MFRYMYLTFIYKTVVFHVFICNIFFLMSQESEKVIIDSIMTTTKAELATSKIQKRFYLFNKELLEIV